MTRFKIITVEETTYAYYVDAPDEDTALEEFDPCEGGKEIGHEFDVVTIEEAED